MRHTRCGVTLLLFADKAAEPMLALAEAVGVGAGRGGGPFGLAGFIELVVTIKMVSLWP